MTILRIALGGGGAADREALRAALLLDGSVEAEVLGPQVTIDALKRLKPSLVVLMGAPDQAIETSRRVMAEMPTPIVLVTSSSLRDSGDILARSGALALLETPVAPAQSRRFIANLRAMAEVKVVRRWRRDETRARAALAVPADGAGQLVAIASSTGGPGALQRIFSELPRDFAAPIVVVQHIAGGFADNLVRSLEGTGLAIKLAEAGETLAPGTIYFAPDNRHLGVSSRNTVTLSSAPPIEGFRPSATHLFETAAQAFGPQLTAVVLTGMGRDGVAGLRSVHECGGTVIAQDQNSSIVFGMPKAAIESGYVDRVLPLSAIARELASPTHMQGVFA